MLKFLAVLMLFPSLAFADVYVIYDEVTNEIYDMNPDDAAVMPPGYKKTWLPGTLDQYPLQSHPTNYKYKNDKFILNIQKISDREIAKAEAKEKFDEMEEIRLKSMLMAKEALETNGRSFNRVKNEDFEK